MPTYTDQNGNTVAWNGTIDPPLAATLTYNGNSWVTTVPPSSVTYNGVTWKCEVPTDSGSVPTDAYLAKDNSTDYVAKDGTTYYVQKS